MATIESRSWKRSVVIGAILVAGAISACWTVYSQWPEKQPPAAPPEQFMETFQTANKVDPENWDRMWRKAGKTPPPAR